MIRATGTGGGGGGCTGTPVPWLTATPSGGSVAGGANTNVTVKATPADGSLTPGSYSAELCIATNDPAHAVITIPVSLTVTAGNACSAADTIFCDAFDGSGTGNDDIVTGTIDADVQDDGDGSTFDFVTGSWGVYDAGRVDDINLYNFGDGMYVYWYGDLATLAVGGVVDGGGTDFAVLQFGRHDRPVVDDLRRLDPDAQLDRRRGRLHRHRFREREHRRTELRLHPRDDVEPGRLPGARGRLRLQPRRRSDHDPLKPSSEIDALGAPHGAPFFARPVRDPPLDAAHRFVQPAGIPGPMPYDRATRPTVCGRMPVRESTSNRAKTLIDC